MDEVNTSKFEEHGVTLDQVEFVLYYAADVMLLKNRKRRRAQYIMAGRDSSGICIAIPVQRMRETATWRPVTAWRCKRSEERLLRLAPRRGET